MSIRILLPSLAVVYETPYASPQIGQDKEPLADDTRYTGNRENKLWFIFISAEAIEGYG